MLPDAPQPLGPFEEVARKIDEYNKRLSHLERLEGGHLDIGARVFNSANISIPNSTETQLTFDSERWDTDGIHSTVLNTGRLTAQTAGKYYITGGISFEVNTAGFRRARILLNGATFLVSEVMEPGTVGNPDIEISTVYDLAIDDFVELSVFHNQGTAENVLAVGNYSPEFSMQMIAAT